jgi:hypothetical protein
METPNARHLTSPADHAELTLISRRADYLKLRSDTVIWRNPTLRKQIEEAYADVARGIGVKDTKP